MIGVGSRSRTVLVGVVLLSGMAGCTFESRTDRQPRTEGSRLRTEVEVAPRALAPAKEVLEVPGMGPHAALSPTVRSGDLLFLSAVIGTDPSDGSLVEGGIGAETRQALENIRIVLEGTGGSIDDLLRCTAFLVDLAEYGPMQAEYAGLVAADPPAQSIVGVSALPHGARVQLECVAVADRGR